MNSELVREEVDVLAHQIASMTQSHSGRLCAVTISTPPVWSAFVQQIIDESLATAGIDFVDITIERAAGPIRLMQLAYEP
jgi:hypothetical protein